MRHLLDRVLAGLPRDRVAPLRIALDRELRSTLRRARDAGAGEVHTQLHLVRGLPVDAALTVSLLPLDSGELLGGLVGRVLGDAADVVQIGEAALAGLPALRRRRRWAEPAAVGADPGLPTRWSTGVDWVVGLPGGEGVLVLAFATSTEPVVEALVELFDALAATLRLEPVAAACPPVRS
ncbi:MAG TPA: hypothetical protein VFR07_12575 [Mycobacteriales bacterium]|nr:hypothetical protein [Mycobacteriales bacterium]